MDLNFLSKVAECLEEMDKESWKRK